ncbi:MAG: hypothetical protein WCW67_02805 [Candidatus Margulisiibacteriota bacterium]|jgi:hypothetical protein
MAINIYEGNRCVGWYDNNACYLAKEDNCSLLSPEEPKVTVTPASKPVAQPKNIGLEIAAGVFNIFGGMLIGCSDQSLNCRTAEEWGTSCSSVSVPLNFSGEIKPEKQAAITAAANTVLAMIDSCYLNGVTAINFVPELDRMGRATTNGKDLTSIVYVRYGDIEPKQSALLFSADYWVTTIIHEIAHHVQETSCDDHGFGQISWSTPDQTKGEKDFDNFVSGYATNSRDEDFSDSFAYYIHHPAHFRFLAERNEQVKAKYELMKHEYFHGQEFKQPWDQVDVATLRVGRGEMAESLISYNEFDQKYGEQDGVAADLHDKITFDLMTFFFSPTNLRLSPQEKVSEMKALIEAYRDKYPKLIASYQEALDKYLS